MTHPLSSDVRQHDTHEELVGRGAPAAPSPARTLDAIIVPASRPAANLDHAVTLARAVHSHLVVLCSREAQADAVHRLLAARSFSQATVIDLPSEYGHPLLEFATSRLEDMGFPDACAARDSDLSMKRNIGLILARMLRWDDVFFLDDDIRDIDAAELRRTASMLGPYSSVGMRVTDFPDNSVVCHAHRQTGAFQDVSVSGSALAVDCAARISFFPDIYNEDWLFFYHDAAAQRLGTSGLNATQLRYDPFADPQRAAGQEFGDVLAEGLYGLLHLGAEATQATRDYWVRFLDARRRFLDAIVNRSVTVQAQLQQKILDAVTAAQKSLTEIQPDLCELYVRIWLKDRCRWQERLDDIPIMPSIMDALRQLNLYAAEGDGTHWAQQIRLDVPTVLPGPAVIPRAVMLGGLSGMDAVPAGQYAAVDAGELAVLQRTIQPSATLPNAPIVAHSGARPAAGGRPLATFVTGLWAPAVGAIAGLAQTRHRRSRRRKGDFGS